MNPFEDFELFSPINLTTLTQLVKKRCKEVPPIGATLRVVFAEGTIYIDGTREQNIVSNQDRAAQCSISGLLSDFAEILRGKLDPLTAFSNGAFRVEGDMELAMRLPQFFKRP